MALDNFIPKNAMVRCNKCKKRKVMFTCEIYPKWIPKGASKDCPNFEEDGEGTQRHDDRPR